MNEISEVPEKMRYFRFGRLKFYVLPTVEYGNANAISVLIFEPHKRYKHKNDFKLPETIRHYSPYGEWKAGMLVDFLSKLKQTDYWDVVKAEMLDRRQVVTARLTEKQREDMSAEMNATINKVGKKLNSPVAQLAEPLPVKEKVDGSSPSGRDIEPRFTQDESDKPDWLK